MKRSRVRMFIPATVIGLFILLGGCTEKTYLTAPPIDHTPPVVAWVSPSPNAELTGEVQLSFTASDTSGIDRISVYRNGFNPQDWNLHPETPQDTLQTLHWDTRDLPDGLYILEIRAADESGNLGISPSLVVRLANGNPPLEDRTPPTITWMSPEPGSEVYGTATLKFEVTDSSLIDSVIVYLQGRELQFFLEDIGTHLDGEVLWFTEDYEDGNYIVQVKAWDSFRNAGSSEVISFTVKNDRPRVIWVPDEYETIQGAINASRDGDTVRVRAGTYYEIINLWERKIWLESELGPEYTIIDGSGFRNTVVVIEGNQDTSLVIRGFTITDASRYGIGFRNQSSGKLLNNIVVNSGRTNLSLYNNFCIVLNNVFANNGGPANLEVRNSYGKVENNIIIRCNIYAIWNVNVDPNPLRPDYNLISNFEELTNDPPIQFGDNNLINIDPLLENDFFHPSSNSPCVNNGNPEIKDLDGSRSDIGAYGGPFAYPPLH